MHRTISKKRDNVYDTFWTMCMIRFLCKHVIRIFNQKSDLHSKKWYKLGLWWNRVWAQGHLKGVYRSCSSVISANQCWDYRFRSPLRVFVSTAWAWLISWQLSGTKKAGGGKDKKVWSMVGDRAILHTVDSWPMAYTPQATHKVDWEITWHESHQQCGTH